MPQFHATLGRMMRYLPLVLAVGLLLTGAAGMYTLGRAEPAYLVVPLAKTGAPLPMVEAYEPVSEQVVPALAIPATATSTPAADPTQAQPAQNYYVAATKTPAPAPLPVVVYSAADPSTDTVPLPAVTAAAYDVDALQAAVLALQGYQKGANETPAATPQVSSRSTPAPTAQPATPVVEPSGSGGKVQTAPKVEGETPAGKSVPRVNESSHPASNNKNK